MKQLLLIVLALISVNTFGQRNEWVDSFDVATIASDTVIYRKAFGQNFGVELNYGTLNKDDWAFSLGTSNYGDTFNPFVGANPSFPFTLNVTANTVAVNGTNKATQSWDRLLMPFLWLAIKIEVGTAGTGKIFLKYYKQ